MLKGIHKNVIMVKLSGSPCFEAAYFVVRSGKKEPRHGEMVREANRIVSESDPRAATKGTRLTTKAQRFLLVLYGALGGAFTVACLWLGFLLFV